MNKDMYKLVQLSVKSHHLRVSHFHSLLHFVNKNVNYCNLAFCDRNVVHSVLL